MNIHVTVGRAIAFCAIVVHGWLCAALPPPSEVHLREINGGTTLQVRFFWQGKRLTHIVVGNAASGLLLEYTLDHSTQRLLDRKGNDVINKSCLSHVQEHAAEFFRWFFDKRLRREEMLFQLVDKRFWTLLGYNPNPPCDGIFGTTFLPQVRITHINGILTRKEEVINSSKMISQTHGNIAVHYVYLSTEGFTADVIRTVFAKMGVISTQARLLAELWKKLLKEMKGGKIVHYAHSLGGQETANALKLMSSEEQAHIQVITIGSPTLLSASNAINYIAFRDGIPLLDPFGYVQTLFGMRNNVVFVGSRNGPPFVDHFIAGKTYRTLIADLGKSFAKKYMQ